MMRFDALNKFNSFSDSEFLFIVQLQRLLTFFMMGLQVVNDEYGAITADV